MMLKSQIAMALNGVLCVWWYMDSNASAADEKTHCLAEPNPNLIIIVISDPKSCPTFNNLGETSVISNMPTKSSGDGRVQSREVRKGEYSSSAALSLRKRVGSFLV